LISLSIAFWINYAVSKWSHPSDAQWRTPMGIQMIPGGLLFLGNTRCSPREERD
jgi:hypothetical protein